MVPVVDCLSPGEEMDFYFTDLKVRFRIPFFNHCKGACLAHNWKSIGNFIIFSYHKGNGRSWHHDSKQESCSHSLGPYLLQYKDINLRVSIILMIYLYVGALYHLSHQSVSLSFFHIQTLNGSFKTVGKKKPEIFGSLPMYCTYHKTYFSAFSKQCVLLNLPDSSKCFGNTYTFTTSSG